MLVVPILVCVIAIIPYYLICNLTIKMFEYVFSNEPNYIDDEEFMDKKIFDKYQNLSSENRLKFLFAVEKMIDEQYNKIK